MHSKARFCRPVEGHERAVQSILQTQSSFIRRLRAERARDLERVMGTGDDAPERPKSGFTHSRSSSVLSSSSQVTVQPRQRSRFRKPRTTIEVPHLFDYRGKLELTSSSAKFARNDHKDHRNEKYGGMKRSPPYSTPLDLSRPSSLSSKMHLKGKQGVGGESNLLGIDEDEEQKDEEGTLTAPTPKRIAAVEPARSKLRRKTSLQLIEDLARKKTLSKKELKERLSKIKFSLVASASAKLNRLCKTVVTKNGREAKAKKERRGLQPKELVAAREFLTMPLVEINPSKEAQLSARGEYHRSSDDFMRMVHHWTAQIMQQEGRSQAGSSSQKLRAYFGRAFAFQRLEQYSMALSDYTTCLETVPDHAGSLFNRAAVYRKLLEPQKALKDLQRAIEIDPDDPNLQYAHALLTREMGLFIDASRDYTKTKYKKINAEREEAEEADTEKEIEYGAASDEEEESEDEYIGDEDHNNASQNPGGRIERTIRRRGAVVGDTRISSLLSTPPSLRTAKEVDVLARHLRDIPALSKIPPEGLRQLAANFEFRRFKAMETIFNQGDPGGSFYVVLKGTVSIRVKFPGRNTFVTVTRINEGKTFGELRLKRKKGYDKPSTPIWSRGASREDISCGQHASSRISVRSGSPAQATHNATVALAKRRLEKKGGEKEDGGEVDTTLSAPKYRRETFRKARKTVYDALNGSKKILSPDSLHRSSQLHALHRAITSGPLSGPKRRNGSPSASERMDASGKSNPNNGVGSRGNSSVGETSGWGSPATRPSSSAQSLRGQSFEVPKRKATARCDVPTEVVVLQPTVHNIRFCQPWLIADRLLTLENCSVFANWKKSRLSELSGLGIVLSFRRGTTIFNAGDAVNHFYVIRKGIVRVMREVIQQDGGAPESKATGADTLLTRDSLWSGHYVLQRTRKEGRDKKAQNALIQARAKKATVAATVAMLTPGQVMGELAILDEQGSIAQSPVTCIADLAVEVLQFSKSDLKDLIDEGLFKGETKIALETSMCLNVPAEKHVAQMWHESARWQRQKQKIVREIAR